MPAESRPTVTGPLQERIIMLLRTGPQCGKDLMQQLGLRSPGTIYPVLEELRQKGLIDFELETVGAVRKKNYALTEAGRRYVRESLTSSAQMFCCDVSLYIDTIMADVRSLIELKRPQRILCTIEYEEVKRHLGGLNVTYSSAPKAGAFHVILSFHGLVGLLGDDASYLPEYLGGLWKMLRPGGTLLAVEIEKTDNLFAKVFFSNMRKVSPLPGMTAAEFRGILKGSGWKDAKVVARSGLLYAELIKDKRSDSATT
jgi:DNA-binding PadR family transcriptional regulator